MKNPSRAGQWMTEGVQGIFELMSFDGGCEEGDASQLQPQGEVGSVSVRLSAGQRMGAAEDAGQQWGCCGWLCRGAREGDDGAEPGRSRETEPVNPSG